MWLSYLLVAKVGKLCENLNAFIKQQEHILYLFLFQVFKVRSSYSNNGIGKPLLALLTNINLYLVGVKRNYMYSNQLVIPYTHLDAMLVRFFSLELTDK